LVRFAYISKCCGDDGGCSVVVVPVDVSVVYALLGIFRVNMIFFIWLMSYMVGSIRSKTFPKTSIVLLKR